MPSKLNKRKLRQAGEEPAGPRADVRTKGAVAGAVVAPKVYARVPASRVTRLYAWVVDLTLLVLVVMVFGKIANGTLFSSDAAPQDIFLFLAYFIIPTGIWGRTPGKWVAGIIVVDERGRTPGVAVAIGREVAWKVLSYALAGAGVAMIWFDKERRGLHDRMAGTWVVEVPDAGAPLLGRLFRGMKKD